ncbi:ECF transporter S component [Lacticigenium naphthae]|uniref:ECF transporter S component n=1 Tax=Lacticigenium naphthae TaxID=515351 RepID=UPI00040B7BE9|nr:ECF transporter S component [Lacticigenium naphthae]
MNWNNTLKSSLSIKKLTLLSLLTALTHVSRLAFQFLPNVQPVTVILMILTLALGIKEGLIVTVLSILLSNMSMGMGVWTIAQIVSYSMIVIIIGLLRLVKYDFPLFAKAALAGFLGYAYGFIISLVQAPFFGIQNFWAYYLAGIPFDTMHALGNIGFYIILAPVLSPLIDKFLKKQLHEKK